MNDAPPPARSRAAAPGGSYWDRSLAGWHVAFGALVAVLVLALVLDDDVPRERVASYLAVAALVLAYLWLTRPGLSTPYRQRAWPYLSVLVATVLVTVGVEGSTMTAMLFLAYPHVWLLSDRFRTGAAWALAVTVAAFVGLVRVYGSSADDIGSIAGSLAIGLTVSLLMGLWIGRVIDESRQRAELIAELETTRAELGMVQHVAGVVSERARLAAEIHDTLAQGFTSVIALTQAERLRLATSGDDAPRLALVEDTARENLAEARALVAAFTPVNLQEASLSQALRRLAVRFTHETGVPVRWEGDEDGPVVPTGTAVVLLRTAQEALANVRRHAGASQVVLRFALDPVPTVEVSDDGVGFETGQAAVPRGFGLAGMRTRVEDAGGELSVDSVPGHGTRVRVSLP